MVSVALDPVAGRAAGPTGSAFRLTVYRTDGTLVDGVSADLSAARSQVDLTGLPKESLRLHVAMSDASGGAENGSVDVAVDGSTVSAPIVLGVRKEITRAVVTPKTAALAVGGTRRLYVAGRADDGSYVFTTGNQWTWTAPAGKASVEGGLVTGLQEGDETVTAALTATPAVLDTATVGVSSNSATRGKWTVLVFINAANSLYPFAPVNMNQMERIAPQGSDVRFVVQWKQVQGLRGNNNPLFSGTRRYLVTPDTTSAIRSTVVSDLGTGVDMGRAQTLTDFVNWAKETYPADHYALVLWNHGAGWRPYARKTGMAIPRGISYDDQTGNHIDPWQLSPALAGQALDILSYDACLMQMSEDYIEMADTARYIVSSEENTPGPGYPYNTVFAPFVSNPDSSAATLSRGFVTAFHKRYDSDDDYGSWPLHQSVLDTSGVAAYKSALAGFADALRSNAVEAGPLMQQVRANTYAIASTDGYNYRDLGQLLDKTIALTGNVDIRTAAQTLKARLADIVVFSQNNGAGSALSGISVEFSNSTTFINRYATNYAKLKVATDTTWDEFLNDPVANP